LYDKKDEIEKLLRDYGVPLVQCSNCIVQGDLPSHGSYTAPPEGSVKPRPDLLPEDQKVTQEKVDRWLAEGSDPNELLSGAVTALDVPRVKYLLSKGADINKADKQGWTPLAAAARERDTDMMKTLVELGANVNAADRDGMTALFVSLMRD